jgi:hypothetical protein
MDADRFPGVGAPDECLHSDREASRVVWGEKKTFHSNMVQALDKRCPFKGRATAPEMKDSGTKFREESCEGSNAANGLSWLCF